MNFDDFKDFKNFMIFSNLHFEVDNVWINEDGKKGISYRGIYVNQPNDKFSPFKLPKDQLPDKTVFDLEEVYAIWLLVKANLTAPKHK